MNKNSIAKREGLFTMIIRIVLGIVFIFSASSKGIDPIGTAYRIEDYLDAYGWYWLHDYAFALGIFLITIEFLIGFALLFKLQARLASLGVLLMLIIFSVITYYDARYNMVPDCGCFGDAIKINNWETFYKNIVLIIMAIIVFAGKGRMVSTKPAWFQNVVLILFGSLFIWFIFHNYYHLPLIDFREWKAGNNMKSQNLDKVKTYVIYQNKKTSELQEYVTPDYPWSDSVWMSEWEFVDQRIDESEVIRKHHLIIEDSLGNEYTQDLIENPGNQLLLISYDVDFAHVKGMATAAKLFEEAQDNGIDFALVCASDPSTIHKYLEVFKMEYPIYFADDIELKAMIRANPGLVYLRNGIVMGKWHYNDFPETLEEIDGIK